MVFLGLHNDSRRCASSNAHEPEGLTDEEPISLSVVVRTSHHDYCMKTIFVSFCFQQVKLLLLVGLRLFSCILFGPQTDSVLVATAMSTPAATTPKTKIAVIGAGAAGLAATRAISQLNYDNIIPKTLEKDPAPGGVWRHVANSKSRPMYKGLRTNLPKEVMAFREKPWNTTKRKVEDSFITHSQVLQYLNDYREEFDLEQFITYGAEVQQLTMLSSKSSSPSSSRLSPPTGETWPQIQIDWEEPSVDGNNDSSRVCKSEVFDGVLICNGHYSKPSIPSLPGLKEYFQGTIMHSIEYDDPTLFAGQTVLCVGGRASGADLAREISFHAKYVYLSDTTCPRKQQDRDQQRVMGNVEWVPTTVEVLEDGSIQFDDEDVAKPRVDTIIFCTGYDYSFPFINDQSNLDLDCVPGERRVKPLYEQFLHARYPNVAFIGLPHSVVPFPLFELQVEAALAQWNVRGVNGEQGSSRLPPLADRLQAAAADSVSGGAKVNGRVQDTHYLGSGQWDYCRKMAKIAGNYDDEMEDYIAMNKVREC